MNESEFVEHMCCTTCGSSDANSLYSDGHQHCFSCGTTVQANGVRIAPEMHPALIPMALINIGQIEDRRLWHDTCKIFRYGTMADGTQVATYYDIQGRAVCQKLRQPGKIFSVLGEAKKALPFGSHAWPRAGRKICITEGEIDAMSVSQCQGNKYPVVSIGGGAAGVKKEIARYRDYLINFEEIILIFDTDGPGQLAAKEAAMALALPHGRVKIVTLPEKDANDMLMKGRIEELTKCVWQGAPYRPTGFVTIEEITSDILKGPEPGEPWPWPSLTRCTFGRRLGEIYTLGAGTGIGKTSLYAQVAAEIIRGGGKVGLALLETPIKEAGLRIAAPFGGKPYFVSDGSWDLQELEGTLRQMAGKAFLYDPRSSVEWDAVRDTIRYWVTAEDVKHIVVDHLGVFVADEADDRKALDGIMKDMSRFAQELGIAIYLISHLSRPKQGAPHEEGGRVELAQLRGSHAVAQWSNFVFGLERDQQAETKSEQQVVTFRVLKDRNTGRSTGETFQMIYDTASARLVERATLGFTDVASDATKEKF